MGKYNEAYSLELHRELTALEANSLALQHEISNPKSFQCSESCTLPLMCINFNKSKKQRVVEPHFRITASGSEHSSSCERMINYSSITHGEGKIQISKASPRNKAKLVFNNSSGFPNEQPSIQSPKNLTGSPGRTTGTYTKSPFSSNKETTLQIKSVSNFVSYYLKYLSGSINNDFIEPPFSDLVHFLDKRYKLDDLGIKFFFSYATVYRLDSINAFVVQLIHSQSFSNHDISEKPTFLMNLFYLERDKPKLFKQLTAFNESKEQFILVYFGAFTEKNRSGKSYINPLISPAHLLNNIYFMSLNNPNSKQLRELLKT